MVKLRDIIAIVESSKDKLAIRYEKTVFGSIWGKLKHYDALERIRKVHKCSYDTAVMIAACSFGKYQIMGFNLYGVLKLELHFVNFLLDEEKQEKAFDDFIRLIGIDESTIIEEIEEALEHCDGSGKAFTEKPAIQKFIANYNGAKVGSKDFYAYAYKMLTAYQKLVDNEKKKQYNEHG